LAVVGAANAASEGRAANAPAVRLASRRNLLRLNISKGLRGEARSDICDCYMATRAGVRVAPIWRRRYRHDRGSGSITEKVIEFGVILANHSSGVKQAAEKLRALPRCEQNHPSAAEAGPFSLDLSARINPCPFKTASDLSFSAACKTRLNLWTLSARLKLSPDTSCFSLKFLRSLWRLARDERYFSVRLARNRSM
jgi:hypothetical protein